MSFTTPHQHDFLGADHDRNIRRTWLVVGLTTTMMIAEIAAGTMFGSMALVADGWHMATHSAALLITALTYVVAKRQSQNERFTFGTGKFGDLAGFSSAVMLAVIALLIGWESVQRLLAPVAISFSQAITVALVGLAVNLISAWILGGDHRHHHRHGVEHGHAAAHHGHVHADNSLRAAYFHVLADALTSLLAILALLAGSLYGWHWMDPTMGTVGGIVIARWSFGLIRDTAGVLVDYLPPDEELSQEIRAIIETTTDRVTDLHVWRVGPGHHAAIVSLQSSAPQPLQAYRSRLTAIPDLSHVTIEVEAT